MKQTLFYTGIGSRETPAPYMALMTRLARRLASEGWILRSGGADGADTAFEQGATQEQRVIYLPWRGFNERWQGTLPEQLGNRMQAEALAAQLHPAWDRLKRGARSMMIRNIYQILGDDLNSPSRLVVCWAPNPKLDDQGRVIDVKGGTGQAVRLAALRGVPVYHLGIPEHMARMCAYLGEDPLPTNPALLEEWLRAQEQTQDLEHSTDQAPGRRHAPGRL